MTIDEAIRLNTALRKDLIQKGLTSCAESIQLGINALIFYRKLKVSNTGEMQGNFLGETKE